MSKSLSISLSKKNNLYDESDYVMIEQEPWPKDVGRTSVSQGILGIGAMIFGPAVFSGSIPLPNCGDANGIDAPVYVYPSRPDLNYIFDVSHGGPSGSIMTPVEDMSLSAGKQAGVIQDLIREEALQCSLQTSVETKYPVKSWISTEWLGECFDEKGDVISRPSLSKHGRKLIFDKKVLGTLRIKYLVRRVTYIVHINSREDSIENNFESVAFCVWDGGIEYTEIKAPSGYELTGEDCGNGMPDGYDGSTDICPNDSGRGSRPVAVMADKKVEVDYCSQISSSEINESVIFESEPGDQCNG